jgi:hypothetical protein
MSSYPQEAASRPLAGDPTLSAVVPPQAGGLQGGQKLLHISILLSMKKQSSDWCGEATWGVVTLVRPGGGTTAL